MGVFLIFSDIVSHVSDVVCSLWASCYESVCETVKMNPIRET